MKFVPFCYSGSSRSSDTKDWTTYCSHIRIKVPTLSALRRIVGGQGKKSRCTCSHVDWVNNWQMKTTCLPDSLTHSLTDWLTLEFVSYGVERIVNVAVWWHQQSYWVREELPWRTVCALPTLSQCLSYFCYHFPQTFVGRTEGLIVPAASLPSAGTALPAFGWDAIFQPVGFEKTYAEIPKDVRTLQPLMASISLLIYSFWNIY